MDHFGLHDWTFVWSRSKLGCGQCDGGKKQIRLSKHYVHLNEESNVLNTILHEIAHALAGCQHGHNRIWKQKCLEIGARPSRVAIGVIQPKGNHTYKCVNCGYEFETFRKYKDTDRKFHVKCGAVKGRLIKIK